MASNSNLPDLTDTIDRSDLFNYFNTNSPRKEGTVLLPTVSVKIHTKEKCATVRGMIGWASQFNLISERCWKKFKLPLTEGRMPSMHSLGGGALQVLGKTRIKFSPHFRYEPNITVDVYVTKSINKTKSSGKLHPIIREKLKGYTLADPYFDKPGRVDLLMGVTLCAHVLKGGRFMIPGTTCYGMDSVLGWIIIGRAPLENNQKEEANPQSYLCVE